MAECNVPPDDPTWTKHGAPMRKPMAELWADQLQRSISGWTHPWEWDSLKSLAAHKVRLARITSTESQPSAKSKKCTIHPPTYINGLLYIYIWLYMCLYSPSWRRYRDPSGSHMILRYPGWCCVSSIWATCHLDMFVFLLIVCNVVFKCFYSYFIL